MSRFGKNISDFSHIIRVGMTECRIVHENLVRVSYYDDETENSQQPDHFDPEGSIKYQTYKNWSVYTERLLNSKGF